MTNGSGYRSFGAALILLLIMAGAVWGQSDEGRITLTTSSNEAREAYLTGLDLIDRMQLQEAREYFKKAVAADPNFALAYLNLSMVQPSTKELFESLNRAIALADKVSEGERLIILATQAGINGKTMEQEDYMKQLVDLYPNDERAHNQLATYYFAIQDYDSAIEEYEKAIKINPEFSTPYNQLGYSLRYIGKYEAADKVFRKYIDLIPDDPNPYDSYAELLLKMGKFKKSIEYYRKALKINPDFTASYLGIATNYNLMGDHQKAREEILKLFEVARDDGQRRIAYFGEAVSYADEGKLDEALNSLRKQYALAEAFEDISAMAGDLNIIGTVLLEMGRPEDAILSFKKAVKLIENSDFSQDIIANARRIYLYNSARVDIANGHMVVAQEKAAKYMTLATEKNNPALIRRAHELAGEIALAEEDFNQAIEEFQQSNLLNPYNHYRLALAYQGTGDLDSARESCDQAAHFNALNNISYAFIRLKAEQFLKTLN